MTSKMKKVNKMIPACILLILDFCLAQLSSERLYPETNENRCKDPEPNITPSSGNPEEKGRNNSSNQ